MIYVKITLLYEGTHYWPSAEQQAPEVNYLKYPHRHMFHINCIKSVSHDDRDIEIITLKRQILDYLQTTYKNNFETRSCEQIAIELLHQFKLNQCEVLEDGENGALVTI